MGPEDWMINRISRAEAKRAPDQQPVITEAHRKASELIAKEAINPEDFTELYGDENVKDDLDRIEKVKARFEGNNTKRTAEVLEAIIYDQAELSNWLGRNAETIKTSEFDDIANGIDLVVEYLEASSTTHLALGVDVTFGSNSIEKKLQKIKDQIDSDTLSEVKYFQSHHIKGSLRNIPRVIIGVEKETVNQLAGHWLRGEKKELANHHVRHMLLTQIQSQLETFLEYARQRKSQRALRSFTHALTIIRTVIRDAEKMPSNQVDDKVHNEIMLQLERFR